MDKLDLLKQHWRDSEKNIPKYSYEQLYAMILKKSSSIVKWILIISLIEFAIWSLLYFMFPKEDYGGLDIVMGTAQIGEIVNIITFLGAIFFISLFYTNYSKIQVTASIKELMERILITRKSVHYFIIFNVGGFAINSAYIYTNMLKNKDLLVEYIRQEGPSFDESNIQNILSSIYLYLGITFVIVVICLLIIYRILYIRLLKKLKTNYRELQEIDIK